MADRPRRLARHPEVLRVAVPAGREGHRRRVLPLDLREPGARAAGEGGGARDCRRWQYMRKYGVVEIAKDLYRQDERPLTDDELDGAVAGRAAACCASRPTTSRRRRWSARPGSVGVGSRTGRASPAGSRRRRKLELYSPTDASLGLAGARDAGLHPLATSPPPRSTPAADELVLVPDLPAAHADPHPLGQREVPQRDQQHATRSGCNGDGRRAGSGVTTGDLVRVRTRIGHFVARVWATAGHPARRRRAVSHHMGRWRLRRRRRQPLGDRQGRPRPHRRRRACGRCGTSSPSGPSRVTTRTASGSPGTTPGCTRT